MMPSCTSAEREWLDVMRLAGRPDRTISASTASTLTTTYYWPTDEVYQRAAKAEVALMEEWRDE